jgi:16S rRNA (uracil1498-N3)-methyltransferase
VSAARRFFVEGTQEVGGAIEIHGGDAHKITRVLRLRAGDRIEIVDSRACAFAAASGEAGQVVRAQLIDVVADRVPEVNRLIIEVAQAVPKAARMDFVVEKGTELGAAAFLPFYSERSVGRRVGPEKLARWRRIARSASQQSGRREVPEIHEPLDFEALVERFGEYDTVFFAWELAAPEPLHDRLRALLPQAGRVLIVVGPEGGFAHAEAEAATSRGAHVLWLGSRILRTDTAAVVLLAVIGAFTS